ncbi:MAG: 23S rRNA (uridine(2552)-2'-O)-methyltransferase [Halobacteriota archaeon]
MGRRDRWSRRAHDAGLRSRAAFKLRQLDDRFDLLDEAEVVVDLGAAPGGWLQVAAERMRPGGTLVDVDRRRIDPLDEVDARVHLLRGDVTEAATHERIAEAAGRPADVVLSDMAPDVSGEYELDHARSVHLAQRAAAAARAVLGPGGTLVVKVFDGRDLDDLVAELEPDFEYVARHRPAATRDTSSELYLIARGFLTAPVRPGDRLTLEVEAIGDEGDGIATVDGFTVFVPDAEVGETVEVEIEAVKPRFAFAEPTA